MITLSNYINDVMPFLCQPFDEHQRSDRFFVPFYKFCDHIYNNTIIPVWGR